MPHSTGQRVSSCLLALLAIASPTLARGNEVSFAERKQPRPTVRFAAPFDPTSGGRPQQQTNTLQAELNAGHMPWPDTAAPPVIHLADAEHLFATLQPSPTPADLPAPREQPLTDEQRVLAEELEAFELDVKPILQLSTRIKPDAGELPKNHAAARFVREGEIAHRMGYSRAELETQMTWEAPALCHRPLYFEEVNLERHGYKVPLIQPALSAAHFFGRVPLLPYMMVREGHRDCQFTLGHYRPGDYAPYSLYIPRMRLDASVAEAAVAAGLIFAIP